MTKEEIEERRRRYTQEILELSDDHKALMLHLPTGFGKQDK